MRVLICAANEHELKALSASCSWHPRVEVIERVVASLHDAFALAGLRFDFVIGLDLLEMDYRPRLAVLIRTPYG